MKNNRLIAISAVCLLLSCSGPKAIYSYEKNSNKVPAEVSFVNTSEKATSYLWDFGDGNTSTETEPIHRYVSSGRYQVTLTAIDGEKKKSTVKEVIFYPPEKCLVELVTEHGNLLIELSELTPQHRDNFINLVDDGYYNDLLFHRVIDGFMIQGGDPISKNAKPGLPLGSGGPGYQIESEISDSLVHLKGALAAARQGDDVNPQRKSSGSQFYIVHGKKVTSEELDLIGKRNGIKYTEEQKKQYSEIGGTPLLDGNYTVFGKVINGLSTIDSIATVQKDSRNRPIKDVKIIKAIVIN